MNENQGNNTGLRIFAILMTLLFMVAAFFAWQNWSKNKVLTAEKVKQEAVLDSLVGVRAKLQNDLTTMENSLAELTTENEELEGKVAASANLLAKKNAEVKQIQVSNNKNEAALRSEIAALQQVKTERETIITMLTTENEALRSENKMLKGENAELKGSQEKLTAQVDDLAKQLSDQIKKTQSAKFKASAFRVEVEKKRGKLTTRAKKVNKLNISFDLADVPEQYRTAQKLYLVITDEKGVPIKTQNPTKATIKAPAGDVEIIASNVRPVELGETQRMAFTQELDEKLKKGNYVVAVYCDYGLLGASSFRLM